jgi:hypothetical protein
MISEYWTVEVTLRPTVSRPVRLGVLPLLGRWPDVTFIWVTITFFIFHVGRPLWQEEESVICSAMTQAQFQVTLRPTACRPVRFSAEPSMGPITRFYWIEKNWERSGRDVTDVLSWHIPSWTDEKLRKVSVRLASAWTEIWTRHLLNTGQMHHRLNYLQFLFWLFSQDSYSLPVTPCEGRCCSEHSTEEGAACIRSNDAVAAGSVPSHSGT